MLNLNEGIEIEKKDIGKLLDILENYGEIIAPINKGEFLRMEKIEKKDFDQIEWNGISWFTSKKYLFPEKQTLFSFDGEKIQKFSNFPKRVLFGLRLCDLNAISINDNLFLNQNPINYNYENFRKNLTLVGFWCNEKQDNYCFCSSMDLKHYYDLCIFEKEQNKFHIKVASEKGTIILNELKNNINFENETYLRNLPVCDMKLETKDIQNFFSKDDTWKKGSDDCLSCGDCTTLCPTCLCFDIEDEVKIDFQNFERIVKWDSCMYKDFTLVAGGHVFRNTRLNRFKHRIYHKFQYFKEKFNEYMCTGCGRCIRGCPTKIDWISLINEMENTNINKEKIK